MKYKFGKEFFQQNQRLLKWFANTKYGKGVLGHRLDRVDLILPNAVMQKTGDDLYLAEFRCHDKYSKRLYYEYKRIWKAFHWFDMNIANVFVPQLNLGFDTSSFFADSGGDGSIRCHGGDPQTWSARRDGTAGSINVNDTSATEYGTRCGESDRQYCYRGFLPFDTSSLNDEATILETGTKLSLYVNGAETGQATNTNTVCQSTQTDGDALVSGDFTKVTLNSPDEGTSSRINNGDLTTSQYNDDWAANSNFVSWISKTGYTKLVMRDGHYDIDANSPANDAYAGINISYSDQTGTSQDPTLTVAFSLGYNAFIENDGIIR